MAGVENSRILIEKLTAYKRKFYLNKMVKGSLLAVALLFGAYIIFNALEYNFRLNQFFRATLFWTFLIIAGWSLLAQVFIPAIKIFVDQSRISNEEAARQIGNYFPEIRDKLLNTLQLEDLSKKNALIAASIDQRTREISNFSFTGAIHLEENRRYVKYILPSLIIASVLYYAVPSFFKESTERIVNYNTNYAAIAPFEFKLSNSSLLAFKNEDFLITANISGQAIPASTYITINGRRIKMTSDGSGNFSFPIRKIQSDVDFKLDAGGYSSENFKVTVVNRPNLRSFRVNLDYPAYTGKKDEEMKSAGNLLIPEGTEVSWIFESVHTNELELHFTQPEEKIILQKSDNQIFNYERQIKNNQTYKIRLENEYSSNKNPIQYSIEVIKDSHPQIDLNQFQDTTLYSFIVLGGNISDDYGFTGLKLKYKSQGQDQYTSLDIPFDRTQSSQSYYYRWAIEDLNLAEGEEIEYFVQVWDNDGVNGAKSGKTGVYTLKVPSAEIMAEKLAKESQSTENQIDKTLEKARELKENIDETEKRLKEKRDLNWQDEKSLEDILEKREELEEEIEKLKEQNQDLLEKQDRFHEPNESIKEKAEKLQELMEELMDEETRRLYEELQRLLDENLDMDEVQDIMDKIQKNEKNLEKELERTLELFKKLQVETKLDELVDKVEELSEQQEELSEKTGDKQEDMEQLNSEQEELNKDFEKVKEMKDEVEKLNQELDQPEPMQDTSEEEKDIDQEQQNSSESLQNKKRKQAQKSQKKAADKMKQLSEKLQQMQQGMEMQALSENLDQLREIVDNLIKLSKDQEKLMNEFEDVSQSDPRFIQLSQDQLKLKDDARVLEDSLLALANRVFQIQSFVTREVAEMNSNMDEAVKAIRDREQARAVGKQHFAMTSMNNLALLLDDVLQQMQQQMADAIGNPSKGSGNQEMPSMSELQKQLNKQIQDLKKSGKTGRALSEELAKMAAKQEQLRKMLQEMEEHEDGSKGQDAGGNQIAEKMEETELDLVNKKITRETIQRQEEILTRLLEFENAMRERELDEQRKGETAKEYDKKIPAEFEEYFKAKEKEIELLKTVPPKLNPYYKKEVNDYFKRISNQ